MSTRLSSLRRLTARFLSSPWAHLLWPLSWVWIGFAWLRCCCLKIHRVSRPVVSIGNLAMGGTGKTPLVILLAKQFPSRRVAILARGYGAHPGEWNDEMKVIRNHLPNAMLYQGKDRVMLAQQAVRDGAELLLLDDGFQHRRLFRDFDLLVVRPEDQRGLCLPAGELREGWGATQRATQLFSYSPVSGAIFLGLDASVGEIDLTGVPVSIFCGLGHPERFEQTVLSLGANIQEKLFLGDHEPISLAQLTRLYRPSVQFLLCTEKDFVKLPPTNLPILCVKIEAKVVGDPPFWRELIAKIDQKIHTSPPWNS